MSDGHMPHRMSQGAAAALSDGTWIIAWKCAECGDLVQEFGSVDRSECTVDWRAKS